MKNILLSFVTALGLSLTGQAQITITSNNMAPVGSTIIQTTDTMPDAGIVPGDAGENKTWNFATLTADSYDTINTLLPSQTPYESEYPVSNYVFQSIFEGDTLYSFNTLNEDALTNLGYAGYFSELEEEITIHLVPNEILIDFPMQYGNHREENFYYQFVTQSPVPSIDSLKRKHSEIKSVDVDAWGTMTLPNGAFNVLRTKEVRYTTDSTWVLFLGSWTFVSEEVDTLISYNWYSNEVDPGFTLCSMDYNNNTVGQVTFLQGTYTGINNNKATVVRAFPNPVSDELTLNLGQPVRGTLRIYNTSGKLVKKEQVQGVSHIQCTVTSLPAGTYYVVVSSSETVSKQFTAKFIKQ